VYLRHCAIIKFIIILLLYYTHHHTAACTQYYYLRGIARTGYIILYTMAYVFIGTRIFKIKYYIKKIVFHRLSGLPDFVVDARTVHRAAIVKVKTSISRILYPRTAAVFIHQLDFRFNRNRQIDTTTLLQHNNNNNNNNSTGTYIGICLLIFARCVIIICMCIYIIIIMRISICRNDSAAKPYNSDLIIIIIIVVTTIITIIGGFLFFLFSIVNLLCFLSRPKVF